MRIFPENPRAKSVALITALVLSVLLMVSAFAESPTDIDDFADNPPLSNREGRS
jgi:hypothetical protein